MKNIMRSAVIGIVLTAGTVFAAEKEGVHKIPYGGTISGTIATSQIDAINTGDGNLGILGDFVITTNRLGRVISRAYVEDITAAVPSGNCPEGTDVEEDLGITRGVHIFENGDILNLQALTRTACLDIETQTITVEETGEFKGGTGQFVNATGTWATKGVATLLIIDPEIQIFGSYTGDFEGTVITPRSEKNNQH